MKFIARFHDEATHSRTRSLLRSKGIPTHSKTIETRNMGWQAVLFVCLEEQTEDALKLMRDPMHRPANPVDAEAFEKALENQDMGLLAKWSTIVLIVVVVAFSGLVLVARYFGG